VYLEVMALQLPGRAERLREAPFTGMVPLTETVADSIAPYLDRPFSFFGHSMGALLAFELARELRRRGAPLPEHLFLSGRRAPQIPVATVALGGRSADDLSDDDFMRRMGDHYGGIPAPILAEPDLVRIFVPILRADMAVVESYRYRGEPPLACPITAL